MLFLRLFMASDFRDLTVFIVMPISWAISSCRRPVRLSRITSAPRGGVARWLFIQIYGKEVVFMSVSIDKPKDRERWEKMLVEKELGGGQLIKGDGIKKNGHFLNQVKFVS